MSKTSRFCGHRLPLTSSFPVKRLFSQVSTLESLKSAKFDEGMKFNMFLQLNYAGLQSFYFSRRINEALVSSLLPGQ